MEDPSQQYYDTQALSGVWTAVWQLLLAMVIKGVLTIFTFGIKVSRRYGAKLVGNLNGWGVSGGGGGGKGQDGCSIMVHSSSRAA